MSPSLGFEVYSPFNVRLKGTTGSTPEDLVVANKICEQLDKLKKNDTEPFKKLIKKVKDRPGHDRRYAINNAKIKKLGWKPKISLERGLELTINWYLKNKWWLKKTSSKNLDKWIKENYHQRNQKF